MRYASAKPFPSYAYLPGRDPHPTRDARGHSFGGEKKRHPYLPAESWRENEEYLFGVDLYNHGYLWEAHEAWENLWHPAKHDAQQAGFLQGLIQCTAASLKIPMEQPRGLLKLAEIGTARLEDVSKSAGPRFMGLDIPSFVRAFRAFAASAPASADDRPRIELA
ncbi:MAG: DUF309 domain-containing protein [Planctomycetota bacterium]